jgi:hypothetical protein
MPVTARLSREFYDRFGDDIANELVEWFNSVDETYRAELRELNERNFALFDARLEQRLAEQGASLRVEISEQGAGLRREMAEQGAGLRGEIMALGEKLGDRISSLKAHTSVQMVSQIRWMVGLWAAQVAFFIATLFIVMRERQ